MLRAQRRRRKLRAKGLQPDLPSSTPTTGGLTDADIAERLRIYKQVQRESDSKTEEDFATVLREEYGYEPKLKGIPVSKPEPDTEMSEDEKKAGKMTLDDI